MLTEMHAVVVVSLLVALAAVEVHPQCFTSNDVVPAQFVQDLSGISHLGAELYRHLDGTGNLFFSPYSIWSALSLAYLGARGNTEAQLSQALKVDGKMKTLHLINNLKNITTQRQIAGANFTFQDANRIYVDDGLTLRQCVTDHLHELLQIVAMKGDPQGTAQLINNFVSETTENRIKNLVSESFIKDAVMVLVNAVYFKGSWTNQFEARATRPMDFKVTPNSQSQSVPMMTQTTSLMYGKSEELGAHVLELPYSGDKISMFIMLPEEEGEAGWTRLVSGLSGSALQHVADRSRLSRQRVDVRLPRFKMEKTLTTELIQGLQRVGITDLFNVQLSDLSVFSPNLVVSRAIHKAFVEVNEEGTEAAAATAFVVLLSLSVSHPPRPIPFHCDRPFLYIIVDRETTSLLFMGSYRDPSSLSGGRQG